MDASMQEDYLEIRASMIDASRKLLSKAVLSVIPLTIMVLALFSLTIFDFTYRQYMAFLIALGTIVLPLLLVFLLVYYTYQRRQLRRLSVWYERARNPSSQQDRVLAQRLQKNLISMSFVHGVMMGGGIFLCIACSVTAYSGYADFPLSTSLYYVALGVILALTDFLITVFISQMEMRPILERFLTDSRGFGYHAGTSIGKRLLIFSLVNLTLTLGVIWIASSFLSTELLRDEMAKRGYDNVALLAQRLDVLISDDASETEVAALVNENALCDNERVVIRDENGRVAYDVERGNLDGPAIDSEIERQAEEIDDTPSSAFKSIGNRDYLITAATLEDNRGWTVSRADQPYLTTLVLASISPTLLLVLILAMCAAAYLTLLLSHNISDPIKRLVRLCRVVATGDLAVEVPVDSLDEVGELSSSYGEMLASLRDISKGLLQTSSEVGEGAESIVSVSEEIMAAIEELNALVQDLSSQIEHEVVEIRNIEEIMHNVAETVSMSHAKATQSCEISQDAETLVRDGRESAHMAVQKIADFKEMLDESMEAILSLGESSRKIDTIVDIITRIAEQTNLLALNAAIEAARVPEYGRGFAVVADEVKKLAQEAAASAQRISDVVKTIQKDVDTAKDLMEKGTMGMFVGVETVEHTDQSLASISDIVGKMSSMAELIAEASAKELYQSESLAGSLESMRAQVENTAEAYEEIGVSSEQQTQVTTDLTGTAERLSEIAKKLQEMVAHFKISHTNEKDDQDGLKLR